ncbi:sugar MFS transporter [Saprospiraceae bacterium]|jgi:FHS family L-fucose permease-like MFS transporter|nr:sugar MFS transporter [bacterium]MDB4539302.1 sugar MFS transporter [Saprospiraceae bacterium]MDG1434279.1 sugar MFS transporter [Saprospiraceae bacterium]
MIKKTSYQTAFIFLVSLFFMWAFLTALNDILVPFVKELFEFGYTEAALIQFCFFGAFFIMGYPASVILDKYGYKTGIVIGLTLMGIGALLFYPASVMVYYPLFLGALFVLATGVTILQVAANPYVAVLGPPETAASRLNLAQGVNSMAKVIAPVFGGVLILSGIEVLSKEQQAEAVQMPYVGLAIALFLLASIFAFITLPNLRDLDSVKESNKIVVKDKNSIFDFPYLLLGAGAIFMYVGAEVTIASFMVNFLGEESIAGLDSKSASKYLSFYWGGLMVGRFIGAAVLQKMKSQTLLAIMAVVAIIFLITGITMTGWTAGWAIILIGFCNSIMWSNIFTLSIDGLGKFTSKGSGLLVMAIVGGAFVPLLHGYLADKIGLQSSYSVAIFCYAYILFYATNGYKIGK